MIQPQKNLSDEIAKIAQIFYNYLGNYLLHHTAEETILEFSCLFLEGRSQNIVIRNTIEELIGSKIDKEDFCQILNHCFYIIINYLIENNKENKYIIQLINSLENINNNSIVYSRIKQKILLLTKKFVASKDYARLKRIAVILQSQSLLEINNDFLIQSFLSRYTYLYKPLIVGQENIDEIAKLVQTLEINRLKAFELKLAQHIIYRSRLIEIAKARQFSHGAGKIVRRIPNPTLLSDKDLKLLLKQYIKKIDGKATLYQLSRDFMLKIKREISYREFKQNLHRYLIYQIEPRNSQYNFSEKLWKIIDRAYYQSDSLLLNDSLILRTCRKIYQALIINNSEKNNHKLLIQLINNLGTAQTVMLLIKIVLICPQAKPDLEQRLGNLFIYYELKTFADALWTIKFLEHFLVAFSIYFGEIDLSLAKAI